MLNFNGRIRLGRSCLLICGLLLLLGLSGANAQSGRRVPNKPLPTPTETPKPEPTPEPTPKEIKPAYSISVVSTNSMNSSFTFSNPERSYQWVMERLRTSTLLELEYGGESNRKKAIEKAKSSDVFYVLLVELEEDPFANRSVGRNRVTSGSVWINYTLFSPTTGKTANTGRAELRPELLRTTIGIGNNRRACSGVINDDEYLLMQASYEVAERVMNGLSVPVPPIRCGR